jgi:hypothetical protein
MMGESIKEILMRRDNMSAEDADELIEQAKEAIYDGEDPEEVLAEYFGLEPDYIFELLS